MLYRLVFTSDGVIVGVVIRSVERYDLAGESRRTLILLMTPWLTIKWKLHCRSRKQKQKNKLVTMFDSGPCDWLVLPLLLPTPTTQFSLDHKRRSRKRNRKLSEEMEAFWSFRLRFRRAYDSDSDSDFWFSLGHKLSCDSVSDSVLVKTGLM